VRILIIDDDHQVSDELRSFLCHDGHTVELATDLEAARATCGRKRPDSILLLAFPFSARKDDLVRQVEADPAFAGIPIFIVGDDGQVVTNGTVVRPRDLREVLREPTPSDFLN
jgi:DNA-binding response OmpR family regulator